MKKDSLYDPAAEDALVGGCLVWPQTLTEVVTVIDPSDFGTPSNGQAFAALTRLHADGARIDQTTFRDQLRRDGTYDAVGPRVLDLMHAGECPSPRAVEIVQRYSLRRRLALDLSDAQTKVRDLTVDPIATLEAHLANLASIDSPLAGGSPDDESVEEFLQRTTATPTPWLIPGLLRPDWRAIIVGPEGFGKSYLLRQIGVGAAYGVHPFVENKPIAPVSVLIVDLENPEDSLHASLDVLVRHAKEVAAPDVEPNLRLWRRPGGIDLRSRVGRAELETLISERRPELVVLGPLYKAYSIRASEGYELPAREVQQVLDDLRTRYQFAVIIEDHAPQAAAGAKRDWRPYGSSFWLRWPEIGIGLTPVGKGHTLELTRWRGDRSKTAWPSKISRSESGWPWTRPQRTQPLSAVEVAA